MQASQVNRHAADLLRRSRRHVKRVVKVYSPGDPGALSDAEGQPLETILYVNPEGEHKAALLRGREPNVQIAVRDGWDG